MWKLWNVDSETTLRRRLFILNSVLIGQIVSVLQKIECSYFIAEHWNYIHQLYNYNEQKKKCLWTFIWLKLHLNVLNPTGWMRLAVFNDRMRNRKHKDFEKFANGDKAMLDEFQILDKPTTSVLFYIFVIIIYSILWWRSHIFLKQKSIRIYKLFSFFFLYSIVM